MTKSKNDVESFILIRQYPNSPSLGTKVPFTTGSYLNYPEFWKPVYKKQELTFQEFKDYYNAFYNKKYDGNPIQRIKHTFVPGKTSVKIYFNQSVKINLNRQSFIDYLLKSFTEVTITQETI